jgi:hypothetical protein
MYTLDSTCWIIGEITVATMHQPEVACGQTMWSSAAYDQKVVTCLDCLWIINERKREQ